MERKAHMNIHDTVDVAEEESHKRGGLSSFTKDRFGKKHEVSSRKRQ